MVAQVGLSLVLLASAGLFLRSLREAQAIRPGFDAGRLLSAPLPVNLLRYTRVQGREFYRQVVERVKALPGVEAATLARVPVLENTARVLSLHLPGREAPAGRFRAEGGSTQEGRDAVAANVAFARATRAARARPRSSLDLPPRSALVLFGAGGVWLVMVNSNGPLG